jgi:Flp pilus assembly protein TadG
MKRIATRWGAVGNRLSLLRNFRRDSGGVAAVEFAIIVPVALVLLTGTIVYGDAIAIDRKVTLTARTVTDLVTQYSSLTQSQIQVLLGASSLIVAPYSASNIIVTVSEVKVDSGGNATIAWSQSTPNGTPRSQGSTVTLPTSIDTPGAYYVFGEVQYTYTPTVGYQVTGSIVLHDSTYMSPRVSTSIPPPT